MITRSDLVLALACVCALATPKLAHADTPAQKDELDPLRERFRLGMESYRAGRYADAILVWEGVYRELGSDTGYRLAFNLGRAYDAYGDSTRAAEHYETYLAAVQRRRDRGEALEPIVERQESEARERLGALAATKGRIRVLAGDRPTVVQIDKGEPRASGFVAYVAPGAHTVIFAPGKDETRREVDVREAEIVELSPPPAIEKPVAQAPPPLSPEPRWQTRTQRPFSETVLWIAGGVTAASVVAPIVTYASALSIKSDFDAATSDDDKRRIANDYDGAKSTAYASLAVPGACAAITGGLVIWWLAGTKELRVPVVPQATVGQNGAAAGVTGSF